VPLTGVLSGTFVDDLVQMLPLELRDAYDLDQLVVADFEGVLRWSVQTGATLRLGEVIGPVFADAVLASWTTLYPPRDVWA